MPLPEFLSVSAVELAEAAELIPPPVILDMIIPKREMDNWCWAAVAVGVRKALGGSQLDQCKVATLAFRPRRCCGPNKRLCDESSVLAPALFGFQLPFAASPPELDIGFVQKNIDAGLPIPVRMKSGDQGHFVVIAGYQLHPRGSRLYVWDPEDGVRNEPTLDTLLTAYHDYWSWDLSYVMTGGPVPKIA